VIEVEGLGGLSEDLRHAAAKALPAVRAVTLANARELRDKWRKNAKRTAGAHGRHYPSSITMDEVVAFGAAVVDIGPDSSKKQGGMGRGFEYGSVNQRPHLDGAKAAEAQQGKFASEIEAAAAGLL